MFKRVVKILLLLVSIIIVRLLIGVRNVFTHALSVIITSFTSFISIFLPDHLLRLIDIIIYFIYISIKLYTSYFCRWCSKQYNNFCRWCSKQYNNIYSYLIAFSVSWPCVFSYVCFFLNTLFTYISVLLLIIINIYILTLMLKYWYVVLEVFFIQKILFLYINKEISFHRCSTLITISLAFWRLYLSLSGFFF